MKIVKNKKLKKFRALKKIQSSKKNSELRTYLIMLPIFEHKSSTYL